MICGKRTKNSVLGAVYKIYVNDYKQTTINKAIYLSPSLSIMCLPSSPNASCHEGKKPDITSETKIWLETCILTLWHLLWIKNILSFNSRKIQWKKTKNTNNNNNFKITDSSLLPVKTTHTYSIYRKSAFSFERGRENEDQTTKICKKI